MKVIVCPNCEHYDTPEDFHAIFFDEKQCPVCGFRFEGEVVEKEEEE